MTTRKPRKWTNEAIRAEAAKYSRRGDFAAGCPTAYTAAYKRGKEYLADVCSQMAAPPTSWTHDKIAAEAAKYETYTAFQKGSASAYNAARRLGILDDVCAHMARLVRKPYTDDELATEARKYDTRKAFKEGNPKAYTVAISKDKAFWKRITAHMTSPYMDWTDEAIAAEAAKHISRGAFEKAAPGAYDAARLRGEAFLDRVCAHMARLVRKAYTDDELATEARKYDTRKAFKEGNPKAYTVAISRDKAFWKRITAHMTYVYKPAGYWTDDRLREEAAKYDRKVDFIENSMSAYLTAKRRGTEFYDSITTHHTPGVTGLDYAEPAILYYLRVQPDSGRALYKIGVTNKTVQERFSGADWNMITVLQETPFETGRDAHSAEQEILKEFAELRYTGPDVLTRSGNSELFELDVLCLDTPDAP